MNRKAPPLWLCVLLLITALLWRMAGAPLSAEQLSEIRTPLWQARVLLPQRLSRVLSLWQSAEKQAAQTILEEALPADGAQEVWLDVYLAEENRLARMTLEGYVCGVVAAEMPAAYHLEALKAQAVAARTKAVQQRSAGGCTVHAGADVCTDSAHCQAYASPDECRLQWSDAYEAYRQRVTNAVLDTRSQLLTYEGEPITVFYHAISGGRTENVQTVFSESLPYLVSVESLGEENARGYQQDLTLSFEEIALALNAAFPDSAFTAQEVQRSLAIGAYTETGRIRSMVIGSSELDGTDFRRALGLRSTWFSLSSDSSGVTFHQRGYGHGVGMSQAGANSMAASGADYSAILAHYYPGTALERLQYE